MIWTDEKVEMLRSRWRAGESATLIAAEIECTRNAILGKVHRLGLTLRETLKAKAYERGVSAPRARKPRSDAPKALPVRRSTMSVRTFDVNILAHRGMTCRMLAAGYIEPTKSELRAQLMLAVRNTAAMQ